MKLRSQLKALQSLFAVCALVLAYPATTSAEITDLADVPLANSPSNAVLPNLMFVLDDSGSMMWDYMPDNVQTLTTGQQLRNCKTASGSSASIASVQCANAQTSAYADPPYYAAQFNQIYYNPDITYAAGVDYLGNTLGDQPATAAKNDAYLDPTPRDVTATYPEIYYCSSTLATVTASISGAVMTVTSGSGLAAGQTITGGGLPGAGVTIISQATGTAGGTGTYNISNGSFVLSSGTITAKNCARNGIDNVQAAPNDYFMYWSNNTTAGSPLGAYPVATGTASTTLNTQVVVKAGHPYYFTISPDEYCTDHTLVQCTAATAPSSTFPTPAYVRYCSSTANAAALSPVSDTAGTTNPKCRAKFNVSTYPYPRYGRFRRVDIVSGTAQYPKSVTSRRTDCANATYCTYTEELQNFANWFSYYRVRITMMKTATGRAFLPIDDRYRVGFITINPGNPVMGAAKTDPVSTLQSSRYLPIDQFNVAQKQPFYTMLYAQTNHGSTPLRQSLSRIGRHYAGVTTGINSGMPTDPVQYSCQQNFTLLTTDGYYNDNATDAIDVSGNQVQNQDNVPNSTPPLFVARSNGTLDGSGAQTTVATPTSTIAETICTANNTTSFPGGSPQTSCGCSTQTVTVGGVTVTGVAQTLIKRRTQIGSQNQTFVDGVFQGTSTSVTSTTFQNLDGSGNATSCTTPLVVVTTTPVTETQQVVCTKNNNTAFVTAGNGNSTQTSCGCSNNQSAVKRKVISYNQQVVTVDGVAQSTTYTTTSGPTFSTDVACSTSGKSVTLTPNPTKTIGSATTANNGGTTLSIAGFSPNPQSTVTGPASSSITAAGGTPNTLADVAMYYYKNDLRPVPPWGTNIGTDNVPTTNVDIQPAQHMVTFTLGLGLQGLMDYPGSDYSSLATGDYANIVAGTNGACSWTATGAQCNWPVPVAATPTALDDLWHTAVNGRGIYYSASDPNSLADGLAGALSALHIQTAAAAASATSSPNITQTNNFIFSSTFRTVKWDGEIVAQRIDPTTGNIIPAIEWSAQTQLDSQTSASADTRNIYFFNPSGANNLSSFTFANLSSVASGSVLPQQPYFQNKCIGLSQCSLLTASQQTTANDGASLVNYLRGQRANEGTIFRARDHVLGDTVNATPVYVAAPIHNFADTVTPSYSTFQTANANRKPVLYIAANDGMLHAFNADTAANGGGSELWAYIPGMVMPNLYKLATDNWDVLHKFSVDGSPQVMDAFDSSAGAWKTVLIGGLNKGGRGFYALDVTNPLTPKGMWEICSDSTLCAITDPDLGYSYGNAVITKRAADGKWVALVTSGVNNVSPGTGQGYLFVLDLFTGAILQKISAQDGATTWGDTTTPSGLSKISAFANSGDTNNTGLYVYGGDLFGNVWRFDMGASCPGATCVSPVAYPSIQTTGVQKLAQLMDASSPPRPQSITSRPELGVINGNRVVFVGTGRYLGSTDLSDPSALTPTEQWAYQQSLYAFKDNGSNYGDLRTDTSMVQQVMTDTSGVRTITSNPVDWNTKDGWYIDFNPGNTSPGERVNLDPQLQLGTLLVITNVPNNSACTVGGDSFNYQFDFLKGTAVSTSPGGVVGQKITGQIAVGFVVIRLPSGALKEIVTGATGSKSTTNVFTGGSGAAPRRSSWRELFRQ